MIEKYKDRLKEILSDEMVVKKRRSTKRRSAKKRRSTKRRSAKKRRSTKRRSTKRRSRFGENETLIEIINKIANAKGANAKGANADENDDEVEVPVTSTRTRDSLSKQRILNAEKRVENAKAEAALAKAEALAKANEALAEANEAPPPLPPLQPLPPPIAPKAAAEPVRRVSNWPTPGVRSEPAPPPTARFNKVPVVGSSLSAARAAEGAKWVDKEVKKLVNEIEKIGYKDEEGRWAVKFITLFEHYENVSDSLVGIMIRAKKRGLIEYVGEMLLQGKDNDVVITVIDDSFGATRQI